jgi:hypothetical protein
LDRPIIITDALSAEECEEVCEKWIKAVGAQTITIQRKRKQQRQSSDAGDDAESTTKLYACTVNQSLDFMMQSTPLDSMFAFVEGLLDSKQVFSEGDDMRHIQELDTIQHRLTQVREALFSKGDENENDGYVIDDSINWFDYFPRTAKPSDCVILAGEGASSTLHRDPFEWTGTNLCLEGRKIWRFLNSSDDLDGWDLRLQSYRLNSTAWDTDDKSSIDENSSNGHVTTISAGWQSDFSLYDPVSSSAFSNQRQKNHMRSARSLSEMDESEAEEYLNRLSSSFDELIPHQDIQPTPVIGIDCCSVVQHPGELLLIPPYWYHQTYAPEPSMAVASQRCGTWLDASRVLRHILALQSIKLSSDSMPTTLKSILKETFRPEDHVNPQETVSALFEYLHQVNQQQNRQQRIL